MNVLKFVPVSFSPFLMIWSMKAESWICGFVKPGCLNMGPEPEQTFPNSGVTLSRYLVGENPQASCHFYELAIEQPEPLNLGEPHDEPRKWSA